VAKRGLFNAYMTSGRYKEAMSSLTDLLAGDPDNPDLLLKKSDIFLKQGDYERAMDVYEQVQKSPYHQPLVNTYLSTTELYAKQLLNEKNHEEALAVIDSGLVYKDNKDLRYMKGLAYEGLRKFDSAYYYQKFYEPSLIELDDFKAHLRALAQKSDQNYVAISHLRARFGDDNRITSISSFEYGRLQQGGSAYVGRIHYAGREEGKGIQGQLEWSRPWSTAFATRIDITGSGDQKLVYQDLECIPHSKV